MSQRISKGRLPALPRKLWKLAQVAYDDLKAVRRSPTYEVHMNRWHMPGFVPGTCRVCLAGAVMAKTLKAPKNLSLSPSDYPPATYRKLMALEHLRVGNVAAACDVMHVPTPSGLRARESGLPWMYLPGYHSDPLGFMKALKSLIAALKKENV